MEVWAEYIDHFESPSSAEIRPGCEPRISLGDNDRSVVLIHGLTDSPFFMRAIGDRFVAAGYDVYLPLLQAHGLREPKGMSGVSVDAWKANVDFAVECAARRGRSVSIGGLSTGGALSVWKMLAAPDRITGAAFLFSAALDIAGPGGNFKEWLARSVVGRLTDRILDRVKGPLVDEDRNPYRYTRMDFGGAGELAHLIDEIDQLSKTRGPEGPLPHPVFIAHSECDGSADIEGVEEIFDRCRADRRRFFRMTRDHGIGHAEVVLEDDVRAASEPHDVLEKKNPLFDEMMRACIEFANEHVGD